MCNRNRLVFFLVSALFVTAWAASKECRDPLQEYRKCQSSSCVKTCANPNPTICTFDCQQGCYCKEPYVLDQSTNQCVEIAKCTKLCRENEVYKQCGYCDGSCQQELVKCTRNCRPGCYCEDGFVRDQGRCINRLQCPIP